MGSNYWYTLVTHTMFYVRHMLCHLDAMLWRQKARAEQISWSDLEITGLSYLGRPWRRPSIAILVGDLLWPAMKIDRRTLL